MYSNSFESISSAAIYINKLTQFCMINTFQAVTYGRPHGTVVKLSNILVYGIIHVVNNH